MADVYGTAPIKTIHDETAKCVEQLRLCGFSILPNVLSEMELNIAREKIDTICREQEAELGRSVLESIGEADTARCLLVYDPYFIDLAAHPKIIQVAKAFVGEYFFLHLQNGVINTPDKRHHQTAWHRDLPYQDFTSSQPLALSSLICLDPFTVETGATQVLPFSHRFESLPSSGYLEKNTTSTTASAGSVIFFDSMLYHRAGVNTSSKIRRGINQMYARGMLRPQIDLPAQLGPAPADPFLQMLLGYGISIPKSAKEFRQVRISRKK